MPRFLVNLKLLIFICFINLTLTKQAAIETHVYQSESDFYPEEEELQIETRSEPELKNAEHQINAEVRQKLENLRDLIKDELERRSKLPRKEEEENAVKKTDDMSAVYKAAAKVGKTMDKDLKKKKKRGFFAKLWRKIKKFCLKIWKMIRKVLPFWAIMMIVAAIGLLIIMICTLCVYCCCCRGNIAKNEPAVSKKKSRPRTDFKEADLDIGDGIFKPYGSITYSLEYNTEKKHLSVLVSNCEMLPSTGSEEVDPYVVVTIEDVEESKSKKKKHKEIQNNKSKHINDNRSPVFNFCYDYPIKPAEIKKKKLVMEIFDYDKFSPRHTMLARLEVLLKEIDATEIEDNSLLFNDKELQPGKVLENTGPGDICFSLVLDDKDRMKQKLKLGILECKNLRWQKEPEIIPNVYIRCVLEVKEDMKVKYIKKTSCRKNRNPYFNEEIVFDLGDGLMLPVTEIRITAVHRTDTLRFHNAIGSVILSHTTVNEAAKVHWKEALHTPKRPTSRWHPLISPKDEKEAEKERKRKEKQRVEEEEEEEDD